MKALFTILMLVVSNIFMTFAWYGNLKLQDMKISTNWPLYVIILALDFQKASMHSDKGENL